MEVRLDLTGRCAAVKNYRDPHASTPAATEGALALRVGEARSLVGIIDDRSAGKAERCVS